MRPTPAVASLAIGAAMATGLLVAPAIGVVRPPQPTPEPTVIVDPSTGATATITPTPTLTPAELREYNSFQGVKVRSGTVLGGTTSTVSMPSGSMRVDRGWSNPALADPLATTQVAIDFMLSKVGKVPYQSGGTGNPGYDCSGLVQAAWRAAGKTLPRTSSDQFVATARVPIGQLRPGDLLFFGPKGSWHVAVYLGNGQLVHAGTPTTDIEIADFSFAWYATNFYGAGRVT